MLTSKEVENYFDDGFLVLPGTISDSECDALIAEAERLVKNFEILPQPTAFSTRDQARTTNDYFMKSADRIHFFFEPGALDSEGRLLVDKNVSINKIGHGLHDLNPIFNRFSRNPKLASICQSLGQKNPLLMQSMYIFKQPRIGGEVTCHQDSTFLYTNPMTVTGLWVALQDATLSNGCLFAIPGGHKAGLKRRFKCDRDGSVVFEELDTTPWNLQDAVPLEVKKGTLVLLHGLLPHLSGANTSADSRHAYTLHVVDGAAHYPTDNWLQRSADNPARGF